jgi:predicted O-methyltransferase YrrM
MTLNYATNYLEARRIALQSVEGESLTILENMPGYVAIDPPTGECSEYCFRDIDFTGPISTTWREAVTLGLLAKHMKAQWALEIGCGFGWTAAHIARYTPMTCIDPFIETASGYAGHTNWGQVEQFQQNIKRLGLEEKVELLVDYSPGAVGKVSRPIDLAFIDGWHMQGQPQRDVIAVMEKMNEKGIIVLHDYHLDDVHDAGYMLSENNWVCAELASPCHMTVFWKASTSTQPRWWMKFLKECPYDLRFPRTQTPRLGAPGEAA